MANRFTLEHFRNNTPIVDPKTGLPTEYFLRMMFGNTEVGSDQQATVEQNAMDIDTLESGKADKTTSINAGTGLTGGGDLSADRTISLADTTVTPGSYTSADITVDQQGRITTASNGSSGGGGALTLLESVTMDGSTSSHTFSSIPAGYSALRIVVIGRTASGVYDNLKLRANGDTGNNYSSDRENRYGSTVSNNTNGIELFSIPGASATANFTGCGEAILPGYDSTTFFKPVSGYGGGASGGDTIAGYATGQWESTAAITSITLLTSSGGNFSNGSKLVLYGLE